MFMLINVTGIVYTLANVNWVINRLQRVISSFFFFMSTMKVTIYVQVS